MSDILDCDRFGVIIPLIPFGSHAIRCDLVPIDGGVMQELMHFFRLESKYMPGATRNVTEVLRNTPERFQTKSENLFDDDGRYPWF